MNERPKEKKKGDEEESCGAVKVNTIFGETT